MDTRQVVIIDQEAAESLAGRTVPLVGSLCSATRPKDFREFKRLAREFHREHTQADDLPDPDHRPGTLADDERLIGTA